MNTQMTNVDLQAVVAKDNELIEQMAKFELSELRLIAYCLAHYDSRKPDNRSFTAMVSDLASIFPIDKKSAYAVVRRTMLNLGKKPLEFKKGTKRHYYNWFAGFIYDESNGKFEFKITPEIQPYLLKLEGTFTYYRLKDVYQFRAASTWKMYELLKRWVSTKNWRVNLDDLRLFLGVAGKYPRWNSFRERIDSAIKEINEFSDIVVTYEKEKRGRKVVGVVFFIDLRQPDEIITVESVQDNLSKALLSYGIHHKTVTKYALKIESAGKTDVILQKLPQMAKTGKAQQIPLAKYITGAIIQELGQGRLFDDPPVPNYQEALDCWTAKKHKKVTCKVRERGTPGQRKKCQICLDKLSIDTFGI